ncbi:response regulator [Anaerohalosphaera lusitana]|nr:response regulator transcription factor [Anaerohalosphaera lusitana]
MATRIILADDHEIMREGLCALIRKCDDLEVVGQASDGRKAIEMVQELKPDIAIMDISMPGLNGIEAARKMLAANSDIKIMGLSTHSTRSMVVKMLKAGALGYMLKESAFSELKQAIETMLQGKTYLCSRTSEVVLADYMNMISDPKKIGRDILTPREKEVLQMVAEGLTTKEIAAQLSVSAKTIDSHREHIMEKLKMHNVASLTKYAIKEGLTSV